MAKRILGFKGVVIDRVKLFFTSFYRQLSADIKMKNQFC